jgi:hypothetical protein
LNGSARWWTAALVAVVLAAAGCGGVASLSYGPPPPSPPVPTAAPPSTLADTAGVVLPAVPGQTTTTTVAVYGGQATISGLVTGRSGPVGGATVQATRYVDGQTAAVRTTSAADGAFALRGVRGGDYQITAWKAPQLDLTPPVVVFVAATGDHQLQLDLTSYSGWQVTGVWNPDPPTVGQPANVAVQVVRPTVGADGVVSDLPVAGASVELVDGPNWLVQSTNRAPAGADGESTFTVECTAGGDQALEATVNGGAPQPLNPPACVSPPPPTSAPPPTTAPTTVAPTTAPPRSTTTTTTTTSVPRTTTTTRPRS